MSASARGLIVRVAVDADPETVMEAVRAVGVLVDGDSLITIDNQFCFQAWPADGVTVTDIQTITGVDQVDPMDYRWHVAPL